MIWFLLGSFIYSPVASASIQFNDLVKGFFTTSQQAEVVKQDRNRLNLEYDLAIGSFYDPVLSASYFSQFEGSYLNQRSDISLLQRTPFWGAQVQLGYRFGRGAFPVYDGKLLTQNAGEARFGLIVPILKNGFTDSFRTAIDKGDVSKVLSDFQEGSQNLQLLQQLGNRYWDWFFQGKRFSVFQRLLGLAEKRQTQISKRVAHGDLAKIEEIEGERTILQRKSQLVQQERLFVRSQLELKSYVVDRLNKNGHEFSLHDIPEVEITKKVDTQVLEKINAQVDDLEVALKQPEVQRQQLILDQSRMDLSLAKNQFLPKLDFQLIGSRDLGVDVYPLSKFQSDAGVVFEFPIPSRAASARIEQSSASVIRQESQFEISKIRVLNSIKESKFALTTATTRLDYSFTELELAQKLADLENKRFLAGDSNLLLLNIREQNLAEAEIRKFEAYADLEKATNDYRVSTGDLKSLKD